MGEIEKPRKKRTDTNTCDESKDGENNERDKTNKV